MKYDNITKTKEREEFTMKKRFLSVLLVSAMGVAALAGCGGGNTSADNGSTAADQMGAAVEDKTDAADTQKEDTSSSNEKLVVYTNSGTEGRDAYLIEKAKEAGFDIEVVALGASEVTERIKPCQILFYPDLLKTCLLKKP